jgi:hypothetical protein
MLAVLSRQLMAVAALAAVVLVSFPTAASGLLQSGSKQRGILKKRSAVMKIEFKRTGGLAPLTNSSGTVNFTDSGASVSSDDGKYQREMAHEEAEQLNAAADPSSLSATGSSLSPNAQLRDGFQYSITITTNEGKRHSLKINTGGSSEELSKLSPKAAQLLNWIEQESRNILSQRVAK